jgi:hypothetical protein
MVKRFFWEEDLLGSNPNDLIIYLMGKVYLTNHKNLSRNKKDIEKYKNKLYIVKKRDY